MRREVVRVALTAVWIALAVLVLPLGVAVLLLVHADEHSELERAALRAAVLVDPASVAGDPVELPDAEPGNQLGFYDTGGILRAGSGPARADRAVRQALGGIVGDAQQGDLLVVAVPLAGAEHVTGAIRAASPLATIWQRAAVAWALLAGLVAAALVAAIAVARHRARRLATPMEQLALASKALGDGDFEVRVAACGIVEVDHVAATQNDTAQRLGRLLELERRFAANASHQLRTPLAGLQLGLETALDPAGRLDPREALQEALTTTHRLQATVDDVLALHRQVTTDGSADHDTDAHPHHVAASSQPLDDLLEVVASRWHADFAAAGRQLAYHCPPELAARELPGVRTGQILDILLDNCLRHGAGRVSLRARAAGPATALDVADEGAGIPDQLGDVFRRGTGTGHGIGLNLAREFATSLGGRLVLTARTPPVFTVFLPDPATTHDPRGG